MDLEGSLQRFDLRPLLGFLTSSGVTGRLKLIAPDGSRETAISLDDTDVVGSDEASLLSDLAEATEWGGGTFEFESGPAPDAPVRMSAEQALEGARELGERWAAARAVLPGREDPLNLAEKITSSVVVEPDEWRLLSCVNGERDSAAVVATSGLGRLRGSVLLADLVVRGMVEGHQPMVWPNPVQLAPESSGAPLPTRAKLPHDGPGPAYEPLATHGELAEPAELTDGAEGAEGEQGEQGDQPEQPAETAPVTRSLLLRVVAGVRDL